MQKYCFYILLIISLISCNQHDYKTITVNGTIENGANKKIVLLSFGNSNAPIILDTSSTDKKGRFTLKSLTNDEELYAIKVDSTSEIWFVNDTKEITINANFKEYKNYITKGSIASELLHQFLGKFDSLSTLKINNQNSIDTLVKQKFKDSIINIAKDEKKLIEKQIKDYCNVSIGNTTSPALKYFYLFYANKTGTLNENEIFKLTAAACTQFPKNAQLQGLKNSLSSIVKSNPKLFLIDESATDFNYKDTANKNITLQSFKNKYLLIDFWESSSKEYRQQANYLLETYKLFKDKNFDILGISLDTLKIPWQKAIKKDSLVWTQVQDTLGYRSDVVKKYYLSSLPYNVLLNPSGKIIAIDIRGETLREKLKELLK
jgi:peroxiredoxin